MNNAKELNKNISTFLQGIGNKILANKSTENEIVVLGIKYLILMQRRHKGAEYLEQLECNSIYFYEHSFQGSYALTDYLCNLGYIKSSQEIFDIKMFFRSTLNEASKKSTDCQLDFIRTGCQGCEFHYRHSGYESLRNDRLTKTPSEYKKVLEMGLIFGRMKIQLCELFMENILSNSKMFGIYASRSTGEVLHYVDNTLHSLTDFIVKRSDESVKKYSEKTFSQHMREKTWKDIWGKRYNKILAQVSKQ